MATRAEQGPAKRISFNGVLGGIVVICFAAFCVLGLMDLLPPNHVMRRASLWGAGVAALAYVGFLLAGRRMGQWYWYPITFGYALVVGALCAVAITATYIAIFDPPPSPADQAARFKELMR